MNCSPSIKLWNSIKPGIWLLGPVLLTLLLNATLAFGRIQKPRQSMIPDVLVYMESEKADNHKPPLALVVEKEHQQMTLYTYDEQWRALNRVPCSTGKVPGRKAFEGDQKSPEGIYFFTRHIPQRDLSETYGTRAFPLDYPNWLDQRQQRTGHAIWLHGTNKPLIARDSNGCVVLENQTIDALVNRVQLQRTPMIIVQQIMLWPVQEAYDQAQKILTAIDQWQQAMVHNGYYEFKEWYAPKAAPSMQWWLEWCSVRRNTGTGLRTCHTSMAQRAIFRHGINYVMIFDHYLKAREKSVWTGRKKLYLTVVDEQVQIIGETYQIKAEHFAADTDHDPLFAAWRHLCRKIEQDQQIAVTSRETAPIMIRNDCSKAFLHPNPGPGGKIGSDKEF